MGILTQGTQLGAICVQITHHDCVLSLRLFASIFYKVRLLETNFAILYRRHHYGKYYHIYNVPCCVQDRTFIIASKLKSMLSNPNHDLTYLTFTMVKVLSRTQGGTFSCIKKYLEHWRGTI